MAIPNQISLLIVDNQPGEAQRMVEELHEAGLSLKWERVETGEAFLEALGRRPDLILADFALPGFDGAAALEYLRQSELDIPLLLVSGGLSERAAVQVMKDGAADFVHKTYLSRLGPAAIKALEARKLRQEKQQTDADLRENQRLLSTLMSNLPGMAYRCRNDEHWTIEFASQGCLDLTGYSPEDLAGNSVASFASLIHPDDRAHVQQSILPALEARKPFNCTYRIITREGGLRWVMEQGRGIYDEQDQLIALEGFIGDITSQVLAHQAQRDSQLQLAGLIDSALEAIISIDAQGRIVLFNPAAEEIFGYSSDEVLGRPVELLLPQRYRQIHTILVQEFITGSDSKRMMCDCTYGLRANGEEFPLEASILKYEVAGKTLCTIMLRDISPRVQAEAQQREAEMRYRTLFETIDQGVMYLSAEGRIISANRAAENILGYTLEELIDADPATANWKAINEDGTELPVKDFPGLISLNTGKEFRGMTLAFYNPRRDEYRWIEATTVPVFRPGELAPAYVYMTFDDITDRRKHDLEREAIIAVSAALRKAATRQEMLPVVLTQVERLLEATSGALIMAHRGRTELVVECATGEAQSQLDRRFPIGHGISGIIIRSSQAYLCDDASAEPNLLPGWPVSKGKALCGVPLIADGETIGVMITGRRRPFSPEEVHLLEAIADMAANAIYRVTLYELTEKRLKQLNSLRTIDMSITASMDLRVTLNILLDQVINQLKVDAADVLLVNPHLQALEYAAGRGFNGREISRSRLRLGSGHAGRAALERQTIYVPDLRVDPGFGERCQALANEGFTTYYAVPLIAQGQVKGVLEIFDRRMFARDADWLSFLDALAGQAAIALDNAELLSSLQRSNVDLLLAYETTIEGWSRALDLRDKETEGHTLRVTDLTLKLAGLMGFREDELVHVRRGALLHDIGKMGIPDHILLKPGPLTEEEWEVMRRHPTYAYELLSPIAYLHGALDIPYCHHEKWDGSGYPRGLKGEQIPLAARIFAVVDVWDAIRSDRPYRKAWEKDKALAYILEQSGKHFDPRVVEVFMHFIQSEEGLE